MTKRHSQLPSRQTALVHTKMQEKCPNNSVLLLLKLIFPPHRSCTYSWKYLTSGAVGAAALLLGTLTLKLCFMPFLFYSCIWSYRVVYFFWLQTWQIQNADVVLLT